MYVMLLYKFKSTDCVKAYYKKPFLLLLVSAQKHPKNIYTRDLSSEKNYQVIWVI